MTKKFLPAAFAFFALVASANAQGIHSGGNWERATVPTHGPNNTNPYGIYGSMPNGDQVLGDRRGRIYVQPVPGQYRYLPGGAFYPPQRMSRGGSSRAAVRWSVQTEYCPPAGSAGQIIETGRLP